MKKILLSAILLSMFAFKTNQEPHKFKVTLEYSLEDWKSIISSIQGSDQLSAKGSSQIIQAIVFQLNPQIAIQSKQDSINQAKGKKP